MGTIEQLTATQLDVLRAVYLEAPTQVLPVDPETDCFLASCSDVALKQIALAGIRTLSLTAVVACWTRGIRVSERTPTT